MSLNFTILFNSIICKAADQLLLLQWRRLNINWPLSSKPRHDNASGYSLEAFREAFSCLISRDNKKTKSWSIRCKNIIKQKIDSSMKQAQLHGHNGKMLGGSSPTWSWSCKEIFSVNLRYTRFKHSDSFKKFQEPIRVLKTNVGWIQCDHIWQISPFWHNL